MSTTLILGLVGGMLALAFLANRLFRLTGIPDVLMLMLLGVIVGPVLGWMHAANLAGATRLLGTLAIILVLFEGGLELDIRHTLKHFPGALLLACLAYALSTTAVALLAHWAFGVAPLDSLMVGAVMGCTSSTVVFPVLQQLGAKESAKVTLMLEASWGDVLAVLTVGLLLGLEGQTGSIAANVLQGLGTQVGIAILFAVAVGVLWSRMLAVLSEVRFWQALTFSIVLLLYAGTEALEANGLIAVLALGLTLSNFPGIDPRLRTMQLGTVVANSQHKLLSFHSELAFLVRTFFFVLIGAIAELGIFSHHPWMVAGTLATLLVARWLAIQGSRWAFREIDPASRSLILWILPRGLITVVLALQVAEVRGVGLHFLPGLAFAVILGTNLMVVLGSARHRATDNEAQASSDTNPAPLPAPARRWVLDAALLVMLALAGLILWYGELPEDRRIKGLDTWVRLHLTREAAR